jgi:MFS family permease
MLRDLGYGAGFILAAISMVSLGSIFSLKYWGALADRFGNRAIFSISHIGMIFSALLWIVVEKSTFGSVLIFVLFFAVSVFGSGNGIAQTRYLFHAIPVNRQNHINIVNMFFFVSCAIGPLLAGLFLHFGRNWHFTSGAVDLNNYHALFLLNGLLFLLPHTLRRNLRLAEEKSTIEVMTIMTRPLRNMIGPFIHLGGGSKSPMSRDEIQKPLDWTI